MSLFAWYGERDMLLSRCGGIMYTQTKTISSKKSPGAIILTAVIAAGLITLQHIVVSIHDADTNSAAYAQEDIQGSIVFFDSGYNSRGLLDGPDIIANNNTTNSWIDSLRESVGQMRQDIISLIPDDIALDPVSHDVLVATDMSLGSGRQISDTSSALEKTKVECERDFPTDTINHPQGFIIDRALDHCLIQANSDNKVSVDTILTHEMMLVIADRAGFDVDLARGSSAIVTRDDLKRFLDYLLVSKQVDGVPARHYDDRITRIEYLTLMHDIIPETMVLATADMPSPIVSVPLVASQSLSGKVITVAQFKQQLNTQLGTALTIMSYDEKVTATPEIQQSIILDLLTATNTSTMHGIAPTTTVSFPQNTHQSSGIGLNKEMLKSLLGSLVQNI